MRGVEEHRLADSVLKDDSTSHPLDPEVHQEEAFRREMIILADLEAQSRAMTLLALWNVLQRAGSDKAHHLLAIEAEIL